ncbi:MAG TPA: site-2 protease family protein [Firmicutes bacterium]|uniref:Site-2 protease family protein n=1 Tax=Capillibacterium thermochitinicola TaxID=2699427 RepID=A0A8J6LIZ8_9FIRM|nr:site-2 protease family protein [Capillibacterium thermochitinicola]MBA2133246.1 site-2 protease family protein [Capillibacterium thermochitinicola]HHW13238.1 site-2 protease family protein [Bacillota bacterium]
MPELYRLILTVPIILFSLVIHEFAHGMVSYKLGDPTPKLMGRLTLSPLAHLDPLGTIMIIITNLRGFGFGWAKPVPVDSRYYRNPAKGFVLVALAGPAANLVLACLFGLPLRLLNLGFWPLAFDSALGFLLFQFFYAGMLLNLSLAFFNLLPIPPLDGSRLVRYFLRGQAFHFYTQLERHGFIILFALLFIFNRPFNRFFSILMNFGSFLITGFWI